MGTQGAYLTGSVAAHLAAATGLFCASLLIVDDVADPREPLVFIELPRIAVPLPPRPPGPPAAEPAPAGAPLQPLAPSVAPGPAHQALEPSDVDLTPPHVSTEPFNLVSDWTPSLGSSGATGEGSGASGGRPGGSGIDLDGLPDGELGGGGGGEPRFVGAGIAPPVLLVREQPGYPETARAARLEGRVILQAIVSATGDVVEVTVLRQTHPVFVASAVEAVRRWKYEPATLDGRPVAVYFTVVVDFELH